MAEPLDWVALRAQCASDEQLVAELLALFRGEVDGQLHDVEQAVAARDPEALVYAAHRLKGALVALAAGPATEAAIALEHVGAQRDLQAAPPLLAQLQQEISRLISAISAQ